MWSFPACALAIESRTARRARLGMERHHWARWIRITISLPILYKGTRLFRPMIAVYLPGVGGTDHLPTCAHCPLDLPAKWRSLELLNGRFNLLQHRFKRRPD
ncbi:hypothetical protein PoB_005487300 [Plakobranchus ocellatus]|uniref:Secreted protein n=1 Tax=Plakobranchus ocellatus TaxID=259542 RepID=A0AAV4CA21_9GAST|nr:hypothetical protein PoB_005487300 [Plakobranchus ocellatus]